MFTALVLVECPHCAGEIEIEPGLGSVFECPHCASDFEVESIPSIEVDYCNHYWGLALEKKHPQFCLDYIAQVDGEVPEKRLIEVCADSDSSIGSVIFMLLGFLTIPFLFIWAAYHLIQNQNRAYQQFFWVRKWRHYLDPVEKAIITIADYKNGSYPTQVAYVEGPLHITTYSGGSDVVPYHDLWINLKQSLRFDEKDLAEKCLENVKSALRSTG